MVFPDIVVDYIAEDIPLEDTENVDVVDVEVVMDIPDVEKVEVEHRILFPADGIGNEIVADAVVVESNMVFPVEDTDDAEEVVATVDNNPVLV